MLWILAGLAVVFAAAMIFVVLTPSSKKITREDFLSRLEKYTEGRRSVMPEQENSYRIDFDFEGHHFWYEDIESEGFTQKVHKGLLKIQSAASVNLVFVKKDRNRILGKDAQMMSTLSDAAINKHSKVFVPAELREFDVFTQTPYKINLFLEDKKVRSILAGLKQFDRQGDPFIPVGIGDGIVFLDLSFDERVKLSRHMFVDNIPVIEKLADSLISMVKVLNKVEVETKSL